MAQKHIRIKKNMREHRWKEQLFQAIIANEQWAVIEELMGHLGPDVQFCIETTARCTHKIKFEMLNVPDSMLQDYEEDPCSVACRKDTRRQQRKARTINEYEDRHQNKRRGSTFDAGGIVPLQLRNSGGCPRKFPYRQSSVSSVDNPRQQRGTDTNPHHGAGQGGNFRQQVGQMLSRVGKHPTRRYSTGLGVSFDPFDKVGGLSRPPIRRRDIISGHAAKQNVNFEGRADTGQGKRQGSISSERDITQLGRDVFSRSLLGISNGDENTFTTRRRHEHVSGNGDTTEKCHSSKSTIMKLVKMLHTGCCSCVHRSRVGKDELVLAGVTPLNVASAFGQVQLVAALIDYTVAPQAVTRYLNWGPLHTVAACKLGDDSALTIAELLLKGKVYVDARDMYGMTALHVACKHRNYHMAEFLTQRNCSLDLLSRFGTALNVAVKWQNESCVDLLLRAGADVSVADRFAPTPLVTAIQGRMVSIVEKILEKSVYDVNSMGQHTKDECKVQHRVSVLHVAVMEGDKVDNVRVAEMLLESGAEANSAGQLATAPGRHFTPLILAAELGYVNMVKVLLQHQCRVNEATDQGETALHKAAAEGHFEVCCLLLTAGARPEAETFYQETPLAMAARRDHCSILRLLLSQQHVNPEHADCDLNTPAHLVAYNGCIMCMVSLLRYGATADTSNSLMTTPLWNAVYNGHITVVERLLKAGVYPAVPSTGMEPHLPGQPGALLYGWPKTPLQIATEKNRRAIMRVLKHVGCSLTGESRRQQLFGGGRLWHYALSSARSEARRRLSSPPYGLASSRVRSAKQSPHPKQVNDWLATRSGRRVSTTNYGGMSPQHNAVL